MLKDTEASGSDEERIRKTGPRGDVTVPGGKTCWAFELPCGE